MKTEYILSFITISIGIFVAYVGYHQYVINKERFKLDLFEKRFSIYKGVQVFLTHILKEANFDLDQLFEFRAATQDAVFLFRDDITKYIKSIDKKALEFRSLSNKLIDLPKGEERSRKCEEERLLLEWLTNQLPELKTVFAPYLKFKTWK